ncbi:MAG: PP2C family protein-serine/threonine phosphatase, partial [Armatimonadota bacterium]
FACAGQQLDARDDDIAGRFGFAAVTVVVLETDNETASCAVAGMDPPLVRRTESDSDHCEEIAAGGPLVGVERDYQYEEVRFSLGPDDILALATDGITEARRGLRGQEFFGIEGLAKALHDESTITEPSTPRHALNDLARRTVGRAVAFADGRRADDMCLLLAQRRAES